MTLLEPLLSPYAQASSTPSPVARMMSAFTEDFREGVDVNLGVGYVNEETLPRTAVRQALDTVLTSPNVHKNALNYGSAVGSPNLLREARAFLLRHHVGGITEEVLDRNRLIFGANGATSLLEGIAAALPPGLVVTADPLYYIYSSLLLRLGFEILPISEDEEGIRSDLIEERLPEIVERLRFFYVVTVGNPSARVLSNRRRSDLLRIATRASRQLGRRIPLVFDGAYDLLIHDLDAERPRSALLDDEVGVVHEVGTFSKVLAPALRAGYLLGPDGPLVAALVQRNNDVGLGAPLLNQEITSVLLGEHIDDQILRVNEGYRRKSAATRRLLEEHLEDVLEEVVGGQGGFYYYLTFRDVQTQEGSEFYRFCTRTTGDRTVDGPPDSRHPRVVYIPGSFCVHPAGQLRERGQRQLRISYGFEDLDQIARGIALLRDAVAFARSQ